MTPSRLERFQAATKDDLAKLPDKIESEPEFKPEPASANMQTVTDCDAGITLFGKTLTNSSKIPDHMNIRAQQATMLGIDDLTMDEGRRSDSEDSEAGCRIELVPISSSDKEDPQDNANRHKISNIDMPDTVKCALSQVTVYGEAFCPILALSKFPYKYVSKAQSEQVAEAFFNGSKFWLREWHLFFVLPMENTDKPLVLVRFKQFEQLLREVGAKFRKLDLDANDQHYEISKLVIAKFPDHFWHLPRYLGRLASREDYDSLLLHALHQGSKRGWAGPDPVQPPNEEAIGTFDGIYETAMGLNRTKTKDGKTKQREARILVQANLSKQLKRAQHYLGLPFRQDKTNLCSVTPMTFEQLVLLDNLHTDSQVAQIEEDGNPVIICVDVEAWERSKSVVTEIGIATLDTQEIYGVAPGEGGSVWMKKIRARHFRIREHMSYENSEFVQGNAAGFEFGQSEVIALTDAPHIIATCFKEPFSAYELQKGVVNDPDAVLTGEEGASGPSPPKRNIVFLGHNPSADISFLRHIGYDPLNLSTLLEIIDTQALFRAYEQEQMPRSVGYILNELDLDSWNLHNAGNDAVYTMQIMIGVCVREAMKRGNKPFVDNVSGEQGDFEGSAAINVSKNMGEMKPTPASQKPTKPAWVVPEEYKIW